MKRLTEEEYWDGVYTPGKSAAKAAQESGLKAFLRRLLGPRLRTYTQNYCLYLLWNVLYRRYLPTGEGLKAVEVGSAPGRHLAELHQAFGYEVFGIEYAKTGVDLNRQVFEQNGINPDNVIHADFFSEELHSQYRGQFDVVISRGFLEHFDDPDNVIDKHLDLLADGGYLLVSIPNFRGLNYAIQWILDRRVLRIHNLRIMDKRRFAKLFEKKGLKPLFCGHNGTYNPWLFSTWDGSPMRFGARALCGLQPIASLILHLLFRDRGLETRFLSPMITFVGVKVARNNDEAA